MGSLVEVTAVRPHRSGYAEKGRVVEGDRYTVPEERVSALTREGLIAPAPAPTKKRAARKKPA